MPGVLDRPERGLDLAPPAAFLERLPDKRADKCAALAFADRAVEFLHKLILEVYVQTHVHSMTHKAVSDDSRRLR